MGTQFTILIDDKVSLSVAKEAAESAFREVRRIEELMSEWLPSSEVSAINRRSGKDPVAVSEETLSLIKQSLRLSARSDGAFDITWAAYRGLWDFKTPGDVPNERERASRRALVDWRKVSLDSASNTVSLLIPGAKIGLGAIAKGYGIDRAAVTLKSHGLRRFLINGGGDIFGLGKKRDGTSWAIGVQHPRRREAIISRLPLDGTAVVSSGDYERYFESDGVRYHHILDLKTGLPARKSVAVTVRAQVTSTADALATAVFVLGPTAGLDLIRQTPGAEAAVFCPDGRIEVTEGLRSHFPTRWDQR